MTLVVAVLVTITVVAGVVALCAGRIRRLHRLHLRTDAARAGLDTALHRRAVAAARVVGPGSDSAAAAAVAASGVDAAREAVENALSRRLLGVDRAGAPAALRAELAEAEQLVVLGRSVYHDAVRDTLDLRSRRLVRWSRLAGTAPLPAYFEIAVLPDSRDRASHS